MILEIYDNEVGNSLMGRVNNIDYDYQAEQWVQDIIREQNNSITKFVLIDEYGERASWDVEENYGVKLSFKSDRFLGEWVLNSVFR